ncbi:DoxX family protein [Sinomicrobium sp. M5D2P9]
MKLKYYAPSRWANAIAYAFFRIAFGVLLIINGWDKWVALPDSSIDFPDPLGIGSEFSIYLAIFAELVCGPAIVLGLMTRVTGLPVAMTFIVAVFMVHVNDSFDVKQAAILYLFTSIYIIAKGSGRYSFDNLIWSAIPEKRNKKIRNTLPER